MRGISYLGLLFFCGILGYLEAEIITFNVPSVALAGDEVRLQCKEEDYSEIYSHRWYKDHEMFYVYLPGTHGHETPGQDRCSTGQIFAVKGLNFDCMATTAEEVVLRDVQSITSGEYRCEIMSEAPLFTTNYQTAQLKVFSEALGEPTIAGYQLAYSAEDDVSLYCSSTNTEYMPNLAWIVSGTPAPESWIVRNSGPQTLGLQFRALPELFQNGVMNVSCQVSFGEAILHTRSATVSLLMNTISVEGSRSKADGLQTSPLRLLCSIFCAYLLNVFVLASN